MASIAPVSAEDLRRRLEKRRAAIHYYLDTLFYEDCRRIVDDISALDRDNLFLKNPSSLPDYALRVPRAMWWELIRQRLKGYTYTATTDFIADMRAIINNCYLYNGIDAPFSQLARSMEILMEERFVKELGMAPVQPAEVKAACSGLSSLDSREILRIYALYEGIDVGSTTGSTHIQLRTAKCATLRRMLEFARSCAEHRDKKAKGRREAKLSRVSDRRRQQSAASRVAAAQQDAEVQFHQDAEQKLEHVPQNTQTAIAMMEEVSPIRIEEDDAEWFDDGDFDESSQV